MTGSEGLGEGLECTYTIACLKAGGYVLYMVMLMFQQQGVRGLVLSPRSRVSAKARITLCLDVWLGKVSLLSPPLTVITGIT